MLLQLVEITAVGLEDVLEIGQSVPRDGRLVGGCFDEDRDGTGVAGVSPHLLST
jgi:hypothetical protein